MSDDMQKDPMPGEGQDGQAMPAADTPMPEGEEGKPEGEGENAGM
jgi:hypothetical protein